MHEPTPEQIAETVGFKLPEQYNASRLLWDNSRSNADRIAVIHDSGSWTYGEMIDEAARIGNLLAESCAPADRVLLVMDDEPAYPAAVMGCMRAGFVPVLINTLSPKDLIAYFLKDCSATAAIVSEAFESALSDDLIADAPCRIVVKARQRPWRSKSSVLPEYPVFRTDPAFWMYSSGSTGRPKGIIHLHQDAPYTAETYGASILKLRDTDICLSIPKIFFAYGFGNSVTFPMSRGAGAVLLSGRPTAERIFDQIARHRPTVLFALPTLYTALMHHRLAEAADLGSVRLCISAAETLSEELSRRWQERFGLKIIEGLGSTEMLHIYLSNDEMRQKPGSAGRAVPGYAVKLIDADSGHRVDSGSEGVMCVRGLSATRTYWNHPNKTADTLGGGWVRTGDCFSRDDDGFYFFKGRSDDLVKVSGQWVYPMEIETALNEHPHVKECCVQAYELDDRRQSIKAWVVLAEGVCGDCDTTRQLQDFAKSKLLPHKYPREIIYLEMLPKTGTNKIDRQALKSIEAPASP